MLGVSLAGQCAFTHNKEKVPLVISTKEVPKLIVVLISKYVVGLDVLIDKVISDVIQIH